MKEVLTYISTSSSRPTTFRDVSQREFGGIIQLVRLLVKLELTLILLRPIDYHTRTLKTLDNLFYRSLKNLVCLYNLSGIIELNRIVWFSAFGWQFDYPCTSVIEKRKKEKKKKNQKNGNRNIRSIMATS